MADALLFENAAESMQELLKHVEKYGESVSPRGQDTLEVRDLTITLMNPTDVLMTGIGRKMNLGLAAIESLQLIGGFQDPALMAKLAPNTRRFWDGGAFHGAYGPRIAPQMPAVIRRLKRDTFTRQAIVQIWDPAMDLYREDLHDYPCTVGFTFAIRGGRLHMKTHMRSNDLYWGWTYDVVQFTMLQNTVAQLLGLPTGEYTHHVDSFHFYRRDIEELREINAPDPYAARPMLTGIAFDERMPLDHPDRNWENLAYIARSLTYDELPEPSGMYAGVFRSNTTHDWLYRKVRGERDGAF